MTFTKPTITKTGFICPQCEKEQTILGQDTVKVVFLHHNLETQETERNDFEEDDSCEGYKITRDKNHNPFYCTECGEAFSKKIGEEIHNHFLNHTI